MALKHLHELLNEDQEPFHLKDYIADKRNKFKGTPSPNTSLQVKKRIPVYDASIFPGTLCKSSCLFSFKDAQNLGKSPLIEFSPLSKSPCKSPNRIFFHIPARTSALLLESALRIQKQPYHTKPKNLSFGLLGSFMKRLAPKNRAQKREIRGEGIKVSVKEILRCGSSVARGKFSNGRNRMDEKATWAVKGNHTATVSPFEANLPCSCKGRPSSAVWSESNEEKSFDMETSTCSSLCPSEGYQDMDSVSENKMVSECPCFVDNAFCESPFRFVLQTSPCPGNRTPEFCSPTMSPLRRRTEEKSPAEEEDEEMEQFSPVSVLDARFEDDYDEQGNQIFDMERSYDYEQKSKLELLHKLSRFEKLAELDRVELEKRILDQEEEFDDDGEAVIDDRDGDDGSEDYGRETSDEVMESKNFGSVPSFQGIQGISSHMKRLVADLISEEERQVDDALCDMEEVIRRVCQKIELWSDVESDTIDMMVEQDFSARMNIWKNYQDQKSEVATEIEVSILSFLMEELSEELA